MCNVKAHMPIAKPCRTMPTVGDLCRKHARILASIRFGVFDS